MLKIFYYLICTKINLEILIKIKAFKKKLVKIEKKLC